MNKLASWWTKPQAFILYFMACGLLGAGLIIVAAYSTSNQVGSAVMQGIGIALLSTATVAAPITLYGNTLFISQLKELTIDKLLEMRLAPQLARELRRETLDVDTYDDFKWLISLDPVEGRPDLLIMHSRRDYTITNQTYRTRNLDISHSEHSFAPLLSGYTPGYRGVSLVLGSLEEPTDQQQEQQANFSLEDLERGAVEFLGNPIEIQPEKWAVMLRFKFALPPRSYFIASIASETCVHSDGTEPFICERPSPSLEITVVHHPETAIAVHELNKSESETLKSRNVTAGDKVRRISETWLFRRGFFPGHGVQLYWTPEISQGSDSSGGPNLPR
jgi:hypothetical protein